MLRLALFASGAGTTAEAVVAACRGNRIAGDVVLVVGNNSRAEVFTRAKRLCIPARHLSGVTHPDPGVLDAEILRTLHSTSTTHIVLAGYLKKLGPRTLEAFAGRALNTHPALLPAFGGQGMYGDRVHQAVLDSGVKVTGATVHHVEAEYDTGPVIAQAEVDVLPSDTVDSLAARVRTAERELLVSTLAAIGRTAKA